MRKNKENKNKSTKIVKNFIIFVLLIILTFCLILKDANIMDIILSFINAKKTYILIAIICMCFYFCCDAINIGRTLKALDEKSNFFNNLKYSLIGFFFSSITPAASGGQPMQIYTMHKEKISVANSTLALLINLTCMQIVTISLALISLCFNLDNMNLGLIGLFILGITLNLSALTLLLISIFSKKLTKWIINFSIKILKFFRVKNIEEKKEKLEKELEKYQRSAIYIKEHKGLILKNLLTTYIQYIIYYSISYWVYIALGLKSNNIFQIITIQSILFATVSGIPSPGAVGVSEGGFLALYRKIFPQDMLNGGMLLIRGINFYLFVTISAGVVILNALKQRKEDNDIEEQKNVEKNRKIIYNKKRLF